MKYHEEVPGKKECGGYVKMAVFPADEMTEIMSLLKLAEQTANLEGLRWCSRRILWLYNIFKDDIHQDNEPFLSNEPPVFTIDSFNEAYDVELNKDKIPETLRLK
ncbi:MAG: hypothetical protein FWD78_00200 [Treponema sp.]|nr:hypothetical protein [Treponema sp.]